MEQEHEVKYVINNNARRKCIHKSVDGRTDDGCHTTHTMEHVNRDAALTMNANEGYHLCKRPNCFPDGKL